jgi:hypothetical protein
MLAFFEGGRLIGGIVSAASALASLITIASELRGRPLHGSSPASRIGLAVALVVVSIGSGVVSLNAPRNTPPDRAPSRARDETVAAGQPVVSLPAAPDVLHSPTTVPPSRPRTTTPKATIRSEIAIDEQERAIPGVVAAADDMLTALQSRSHAVRGRLRSTQSEPDASLQGLITTDLTLDVKLIDAEGVIQDAFTITSRGGGFTADASGLQARERLRHALEQHIWKEPL